MAFVMMLSYSRQIFLRFFLDARLTSFLRGHFAAFGEWQGVPRIVLYDNLRSAVLERHGAAIRFHPTLLDFAGHYQLPPPGRARPRRDGRALRRRDGRCAGSSSTPAFGTSHVRPRCCSAAGRCVSGTQRRRHGSPTEAP